MLTHSQREWRWLSIARRLVGLGLIVLGGWLVYQPFAHSAALDRYGDQLRRTGTPVQATVVREMMGYEHHGNFRGPPAPDTPEYAAYLRYEVGGQWHELGFACDNPCPADGSAVQIWVNPNDPRDFVDQFGTLSGSRNDSHAVTGFVGLGVVFLGFVALVWPRRQAPATVAELDRLDDGS